MPRIALGSIGIPLSMPSGPAGTAGIALTLVAGNAEPTWLKAGAAEAQLCGTESVPSEAARPIPAVTWALPTPDAPKVPVPGLKPLPSVNPNIRIWLARTADLGPRDPTSEPAEPIAERPKVDIDVAEPPPEARLITEVSAVDDVGVVSSDDSVQRCRQRETQRGGHCRGERCHGLRTRSRRGTGSLGDRRSLRSQPRLTGGLRRHGKRAQH